MERQLFRAVCLTLLVGAVLSCVASETSEQKTEVDFTATIPKGGLERDVQQVFSLGPSGKLQVVDETGDAVYLPQPSEAADEPSSDPYSAAYLFENGACDFTKMVVFKEAFPGYTKPLWVSDETPSGESKKASTRGIVKYTFTNPPAEYVGGRVSFCVRFRTVLAAGSQSETNTGTGGTSSSPGSGNSGGATIPNVPDTEDDKDQSVPEKPPPSEAVPHPPEDGDPDEPSVLPGQTDHNSVGESVVLPDSLRVAPSRAGIPAPSPESAARDTNPNVREYSPFSESREKPTDETLRVKEGSSAIVTRIRGHDGAPPKRFDETPAVEEAYLTVVVHSAAWSSAAGMGGLPAVFLTVVAALLQVS
ncbi:unnamed protein product [Neospora caninum Liverpool]|uniref:Toxoplasma gondii family A protein n=1 Tax=Neospora caninum (strain Liverpool) TaxID=572307 RepID=F0VRI9_NEOCL|nr:uncharacterized protein NCLIV_067620 [Neospora caninum Liverpool]CBZ56337.1 unnamed protein product [Neospora caninum Liverpool]CEL71097.1 TPA: hypothetical protein BN1204_067620 [Neospora caninum Liverpool]|eukprot:XP_003886362.1 uncharacterized protein NCLIV_067620 [Neospora caninum Liverpool]